MRNIISLTLLVLLVSCAKKKQDEIAPAAIVYRNVNISTSFNYAAFSQTNNNNNISDTLLPEIQIGYVWWTSPLLDPVTGGYDRLLGVGLVPASNAPLVEFYDNILNSNETVPMNDSFYDVSIGYDYFLNMVFPNIFEVSTWVQNTGTGNYELQSYDWPYLSTPTDTGCYIGFRCKRDDNNSYYGWLHLKLNLSGTNALYTITEIARWNVPNRSIETGQKL